MNKSLQQLLSLKGKTAVVTGGAGYLGTAICETLAELGANLVIASRDRAKCEKRCEEIVRLAGGSIQAVGLELDVLKKDSAPAFFDQVHEHFKAVDILVNNAWSGNKNSWESITDVDWDHDINMSLNSVFRLTKAAFPDLKTTRGVILNIASMYGNIGSGDAVAYCASKGSVRLLTKAVALYCAGKNYGIRVNSVHPTYVDSEMLDPIAEMLGGREAMRAALSGLIPVGRLATPHDIAQGILFLASDEAAMMTGAELTIDGGQTAGIVGAFREPSAV